jgi:hypothetical protein
VLFIGEKGGAEATATTSLAITNRPSDFKPPPRTAYDPMLRGEVEVGGVGEAAPGEGVGEGAAP